MTLTQVSITGKLLTILKLDNMLPKNRQITTGFNVEKQQGIILQNIKTGDFKEHTKSEAQRILATESGKYRIYID